MNPFQTSENDPHLRDELNQWTRILSRGDTRHGMLLVIIQKLCTAIHELEPAHACAALHEERLSHFKSRLASRTQDVLQLLQENQLDSLGITNDYRDILTEISNASTLQQLVDLVEPVHMLNHKACDAMDQPT